MLHSDTLFVPTYLDNHVFRNLSISIIVLRGAAQNLSCIKNILIARFSSLPNNLFNNIGSETTPFPVEDYRKMALLGSHYCSMVPKALRCSRTRPL